MGQTALKGLTIRRLGSPRAFRYTGAGGKRVATGDLARIKGLVIPPAWRDVRIAASAGSKVQAVGYDAAGRRQYLYHPSFRERAEKEKFARMPAFGRALKKIRERARRDLRKAGLPREKVLAAVVLVMDQTFIRVGSEEYARKNGSYGLTTLQDRHMKASSARKVRLAFKGKSGIAHEIDLEDPKLARIVRQCRDLPGSELFQYLDEHGDVHDVKAADVNAYLKEISGADFTAKDFRTWAGTALACAMLRRCPRASDCGSKTKLKKVVTEMVREVAGRLGNTPAVCRKSYIHPGVVEAYIAGTLRRGLGEGRDAKGHLAAEEEEIVRRLLNKA